MSPGVDVTGGETTVTYDPAVRRLTVEHAGEAGATTLLSGTMSLALGDDTAPLAGSPASVDPVPDAEDGVRIAHDDDWQTRVDLVSGRDHVDVCVSVRLLPESTAELGDLRVLADADAPGFGAGAAVYRHGYQSWTPTGTLPVGESFPEEPADNVPMMLDPGAPADTSNYLTALVGDEGSPDCTLGFLDHSRFVTRFDVARDGEGVHQVDAVCPGDGTVVRGDEGVGTRIDLPPLRIDATNSVSAAVESIAEATADRMDARVPDRVPTGWCSWYHYFTAVTTEDLHENVDALADWGVPLDLVQLDDGYQTAFGDWRTLAEGFEDMAGLVEDVDAAGYEPGLWLAPFYVQADSALVQEHPEWLITEDSEPVDAGARHGPMYGLDTTHPGVQEWLRETFTTIVSDWGFEYLKLDFLYAAALAGDRHDDGVTRAEAYRQGMATIREAVGDDTFILGCGAPQGPSVGLVDAMRVGPDTAPHWANTPASEPAHENAIRNVLNRQWTHRRWWVNDPDCQLVRETTDLSLAERRSFAAIVGLLGGSNFVSDRVAEIEDVGRELVERSLPPVEDGRVQVVGEAEIPTRIVTERDADGGRAVAVFNWDDEPRTLRVDPEVYGCEGGPAWDAFREEVHAGAVEREAPAHGCLLVHLAPPRDRPHLLGTAHLAGLASQVEATGWDDTGTLTVELAAEQPQSVVVAVPDDWRLDGCAPGDDGDEDSTADVARVTLTPGENALRFRTTNT
ncbi:alpha-galactosidase [Haloarchaeobius amylolyticus]|uniref:alpha-galactosidase n=1 Tax=Haloarchaeobius amylolyticus TaxID=1198296 RepID=UPI00226EFCAC|nr:alpha-galactosidase [Haloarchaeobius amylolyticus]